MGPSVFRERDDESNFGAEFPRGGVQETYDSCWSGTRFEDLVVRGVDDEARVRQDPLFEEEFDESLLRGEGTEGEVLVDLGMVFGVVPIPVTVDRRLHMWSMGWAYGVGHSGTRRFSTRFGDKVINVIRSFSSMSSKTLTPNRDTHVEGDKLHPIIFQIFHRKTEVRVKSVCHCLRVEGSGLSESAIRVCQVWEE